MISPDTNLAVGFWVGGNQRGFLYGEDGSDPLFSVGRTGGARLDMQAAKSVFRGGSIWIEDAGTPALLLHVPGRVIWKMQAETDNHLRFRTGDDITHASVGPDGHIYTRSGGGSPAWYDGYANSVRAIRKASRYRADKPGQANATVIAADGAVMDGLVFSPSDAGSDAAVRGAYFSYLQVQLANGNWYGMASMG